MCFCNKLSHFSVVYKIISVDDAAIYQHCVSEMASIPICTLSKASLFDDLRFPVSNRLELRLWLFLGHLREEHCQSLLRQGLRDSQVEAPFEVGGDPKRLNALAEASV
jgi:hypothetical protein